MEVDIDSRIAKHTTPPDEPYTYFTGYDRGISVRLDNQTLRFSVHRQDYKTRMEAALFIAVDNWPAMRQLVDDMLAAQAQEQGGLA